MTRQNWLEGECPICEGHDIKDLGWVKNRHVMICKVCGSYLAREVTITVIHDPELLAAVDVEGTP